MSGSHEIYAVKFAQNDSGVRGHYFLGPDGDPHDAQMRLDYLVWVIRSPGQDIVLDAGFTAERNRTRRRTHIEDPSVALTRLGVHPGSVPLVILSHLHYDHCGDLAPFVEAQFVLQERELAFWTGPYARRGEFARHVEVDDIERVQALHREGRVRLVDGDRELADGVSVHLLGGHTPGMQIVRVRTARGWVVLASDASHFYENIEGDKPFAVHADVIDVYKGFDEMNRLAAGGFVVAGHDPSVLDRFPAVVGLEGRAVRVA